MGDEPKPIKLTLDEAIVLFAEASEREDFRRAAIWADLILKANDPPVEANA